MIQSDKHPEQSDFANLTDYSLECPKGLKTFFAFVGFTDFSRCLLANIFAPNRTAALLIALNRFADCSEYISQVSLYEREN